MAELQIPEKTKKIITDFTNNLKDIYGRELVSLIAYGSAVSGGFVPGRSHLDLLVVLEDNSLDSLKKAHALIKRNKNLHALFFSEKFISNSLDTFPIEFLDIKEGYLVLSGKDILQDKTVETANLRFQCEAELKEKIITLKQQYIKICRDPGAMRQLLLVSFSSVLHILKSVLRVVAQKSPQAKENIIRESVARFAIDAELWEKLLSLKNGKTIVTKSQIEEYFKAFVRDLEKIADSVDAL